MTMVVAVAVVIMPWVIMSLGIAAEMFVTNGVFAPVCMGSFPIVKARHTTRVAHHPDIAGTQIIILRADDTHIFVPVPDISVRNPHRHRY